MTDPIWDPIWDPKSVRFGIPKNDRLGSPQQQQQLQNYPIGPACLRARRSVVGRFGEEIIIDSVAYARGR